MTLLVPIHPDEKHFFPLEELYSLKRIVVKSPTCFEIVTEDGSSIEINIDDPDRAMQTISNLYVINTGKVPNEIGRWVWEAHGFSNAEWGFGDKNILISTFCDVLGKKIAGGDRLVVTIECTKSPTDEIEVSVDLDYDEGFMDIIASTVLDTDEYLSLASKEDVEYHVIAALVDEHYSNGDIDLSQSTNVVELET